MNSFDYALIGDDDDNTGLEGFSSFKKKFKKSLNPKKALKKALKGVKKVVQTADKIHNKIHKGAQKILPKKIRRAIERIEDNPRFKRIRNGVKIAVASYFLGPVAGKVFGSAAGALVGKGAAALGAKGSLASTIVSNVGAGVFKEGTKQVIQKKISKKARKALLKSNFEIVKKLSVDPVYGALVADMKAKGLTDTDIADMWRDSDTFQTLVKGNVIKISSPQYAAEYVAGGVPENIAQALGMAKAAEVSEEEVGKVSPSKAGALALLAIPLIFAAVGG